MMSESPAHQNQAQENPTRENIGASRLFGFVFALLGALGLFFSGLILNNELTLKADPDFVPACSVNSVISCTDVMDSAQSSAFGFSNLYIGLVGFAFIILFGLLLAFGVRFPQWVWAGLLAGMVFAVVFVHWMAYQAVFVIAALCLYCMGVWIVTLPLFLMVLVHFVRARAASQGKPVGEGIAQPVIVLVAWYVGFAVIIVERLFL